MTTITGMFLLSLLAIFLAEGKTEDQSIIKPEWSKFAKCSQLLIEAVSHLARKVVPTVVDINKCTGYVAVSPPKGTRYLLWYAKAALEFLKRVVVDKPDCLLSLLNKVSGTLTPYVTQIRRVGCMDENDYFL